MATWIRSKYPGVYYREHPTRRHGPHPDRYLTIRYSCKGKRHQEALGWTSSGISMTKASNYVGEIKENIRTGSGPTSLAEIRALRKQKRTEEKARLTRSTMTFGKLADLYIAWARTAKSSWKDDQGRINTHLRPALGKRPLDTITTTTINELKVQLEQKKSRRTKRKLAAGTVIQCLTLVRQIFNFARETPLGPADPLSVIYTGANPAKLTRRKGYGVRLPILDNARLRTLTPWEERKLLDAIEDNKFPDHRDIIELSLDTGVRRSEVTTLRKEHVIGEGSTIHLVDTKGGINRSVYPKKSIPMLQNRLHADGSPYLFPGKNNMERDADAVSRSFSKIVKASGLNDGVTDPRMRVTLHTLRHTYATRLYLAKRDIFLVQKRLGHADISTTQKYVHLAEDLEIRIAAEAARARA